MSLYNHFKCNGFGKQFDSFSSTLSNEQLTLQPTLPTKCRGQLSTDQPMWEVWLLN